MTMLPLLAKSYRFELPRDTVLNGVSLNAGVYKLEVNSTQTKAEIYGRGRLAVSARVEVKPLGSATGETVLINKHGAIAEYRSNRERIRFVSEDSQNLSSGN
jgi:hypothetical protein